MSAQITYRVHTDRAIVTVYDEQNTYCGLGSKYVATPSVCLPRNGTSQFTVDCPNDSISTTAGTPSASSSIPTTTTTAPTSASTDSNGQSPATWEIAVAIVFPILGLLLTGIGTLIAYMNYKKGGKVKDIVQRTGTVLSRSGTQRIHNTPMETSAQMSSV